MKVLTSFKQATPEWWLARRGIPSASNFDRIITPRTMKIAAAADEYVHELIGDMFREPPTQDDLDRYLSKPIQHGRETEAEARAWYSMETGADVVEVGLCVTDDGRFCCSPDGLIQKTVTNPSAMSTEALQIGADEEWIPQGGLELKCPQPKTHVRYLLDACLPVEYRCQVHGSLQVSGLPWWDFVSYCPGLPALRVRVVPDDFTKKLAEALGLFDLKLKHDLAKIRQISTEASYDTGR